MSKFNEYLSNAWKCHGDQPQAVISSLAEGVALIESESQIGQLCQLTIHIYADHLSDWAAGEKALQQFTKAPTFSEAGESGAALRRSLAILNICQTQEMKIEGFNSSDQIRILTAVAGALGTRDLATSSQYLETAMTLAQNLTEPGDPAFRALAVCGNNLACTYEEQSVLSPTQETALLRAADCARLYWEKIGTWKEVMWAEYRLTMSCLKAKQFKRALLHSETCLSLAKLNQAPPGDVFYAYEAAALAQKALGHQNNFETMRSEALSQLSRVTSDQRSRFEKAEQSLLNA